MQNGYLTIVDHNNRPIPAAEFAGNYEGASYGLRLGTWGMSSSGPSSSLSGSIETLRSRSRQLVRNDPNAAGGMDTLVANLVGTGITPRWLKIDTALKEQIIDLWEDWVPEADKDRRCNFYGLQELCTRAIVEAGEVLIRFHSRRLDSGLSVPLQLQVLEGDHLDASYNTMAPNGNEIRMGIEFKKSGERAAYWLWKEHPGETFITSGMNERIRVPAEQILHIFRPLRPGQQRGAPWLHSVILTQHDINQFDDAEIVRKKGAAMFGGFITENPTYGTPGAFPPIGGNPQKTSDDREIIPMEPGTFPKLPFGTDVKFSQPADVGGNYEAFTKRQDRRAARGFGGLTYEKYTGDLEGVTYSSIRSGNLEFQRVCRMIIFNVLAFQLCRPVTQKWMDRAVLSSALQIEGYVKNRRKYHRIAWDIDGWEWVDPLKDVQAEEKAVRAGFKSRSQVIGERYGHDSERVDKEIAEDNARADENGNVYDSDPRKTARSGEMQDPETEEAHDKS